MKKLAIIALIAVGTIASADVFNYSLGSFGPFDNTTGFTSNGSHSSTGPVRGYYVSGTWNRVTGTSASSSMRTILSDGTTTWASAHMGGNTSTAVTTWNFGQFSNRANNSAFNDPATPAGGLTGNVFTAAAVSANYSIKFLSGSSTMTSTMTNASLTLVTDAVAPMSGNLTGVTTTFARPSTLTVAQTLTTFRYNVHTFVAPTTGTYMVAGNWLARDATGAPIFYDGHLELYEGAFNPLTPLVNLIGVDDDGLQVPPGTSVFNSSAMWLNLTAGQSYSAVATTFSAGSTGAVNPYTIYVAGPVPEPATMAILGLGVIPFLRRRKK